MARGLGAAAGFGLAAGAMTMDNPLMSGISGAGGLFAGGALSLGMMGNGEPSNACSSGRSALVATASVTTSVPDSVVTKQILRLVA